MKKILTFLTVLALAFAAAFTFTACPTDGGGGGTTSDTTPPAVTGVTPGSEANVNGNVVITFSEAMDATPGTVTLKAAAGDVITLSDGRWTTNSVYTIRYSGLTIGVTYTVNISGFKDAAGNVMADDSSHSFTPVPDTVPPRIDRVTPSGTAVAISGDVVITFNETMDTTGHGTVALNDDPITVRVWTAGDTVLSIPYGPLTPGTFYTINISGFRDIAGNTMAADNSHSFTTSGDAPTEKSAGLYKNDELIIPFDKTSEATKTESFNTAIAKVNNDAGSFDLLLDADVSVPASLLNVSLTLTIKGLGGNRTISLSSPGSLFTVRTSGANLILGNNITLKGLPNNTSALVNVDGGRLYMENGSAITGNTVMDNYARGGGVYVTGGTFTMNGGEISGNTVTGIVVDDFSESYGGGVYVADGDFTMSGGKISNNTHVSDAEYYENYGGGVYVANGNFTMSGGEISGHNSRIGGGVCVAGGTFTLNNNGKISGNNSIIGGGVTVFGAGTNFIMTNGEISNNISDWSGGGLYLYGDGDGDDRVNFALSGGEIKNNSASHAGGGMYICYVNFEMSGGTISGNNVTTNGHDVDDENWGGGVYMEQGTFTMTSGAISGNTVTGGVLGIGGGVAMRGDVNFTMSGGEISDNTATGRKSWGGGVFTSSKFNLTGTVAAIKNNKSNGVVESMGGGVYLYKYGGVLHMASGTIYGSNETDTSLRNTVGDGGTGAALFVDSGATAQRGTFSGNTWTSLGNLATDENTIKVVNGALQP